MATLFTHKLKEPIKVGNESIETVEIPEPQLRHFRKVSPKRIVEEWDLFEVEKLVSNLTGIPQPESGFIHVSDLIKIGQRLIENEDFVDFFDFRRGS